MNSVCHDLNCAQNNRRLKAYRENDENYNTPITLRKCFELLQKGRSEADVNLKQVMVYSEIILGESAVKSRLLFNFILLVKLSRLFFGTSGRHSYHSGRSPIILRSSALHLIEVFDDGN